MAGSREFKKIVVGVDGSEESVEALRQAQTLAEPLGARVTCWEFPQLYDGYVTMRAEDFRGQCREGPARHPFPCLRQRDSAEPAGPPCTGQSQVRAG